MLSTSSDSNHHKALLLTSLELLCYDTSINSDLGHFLSSISLNSNFIRVWCVSRVTLPIVMHKLEVKNWAEVT
jgi:hypothetical protein